MIAASMDLRLGHDVPSSLRLVGFWEPATPASLDAAAALGIESTEGIAAPLSAFGHGHVERCLQ